MIAAFLVVGALTAGAPTPPDPMLYLETQHSVALWHQAGVDTCPAGVTVEVRDDLPVVWSGSSSPGSCAIAISADWLRSARKFRQPEYGWNVQARTWECAVVRHEVGHAMGLHHADLPRGSYRDRPCRQWVRRFFVRRR